MTASILVTGGAGYIGSITCVRLIECGYRPVVLDNFCNSHPLALARIEQLTGERVAHVRGDVRDGALLDQLLQRETIDAVIHFAGLKAVGESVAQPLAYYDANVQGSLSLLRALDRAAVRKLVFSSSATVYGEPQRLPLTENAALAPSNPYGHTKLAVERMLIDQATARADFASISLRYFNPVGAHPSGMLGEDPRGVPNNLLPFIAQVAVGRREALQVYGSDYPTLDGTGVRDYVHVLDLAEGHVAALRYLDLHPGAHRFNLGTGVGHSVLQVVAAFEQSCGKRVPYRRVARRPGDLAALWADPSLAQAELGWMATRDLPQMCADAWRWQSQNPNGYGT